MTRCPLRISSFQFRTQRRRRPLPTVGLLSCFVCFFFCCYLLLWMPHSVQGIRRRMTRDEQTIIKKKKNPWMENEPLVVHDVSKLYNNNNNNMTSKTTTTDRTTLAASSSSSYTPKRQLSPEDHRVSNLPLLLEEDAELLQHYAGHLPASPHDDDKYLFYWLFYPDAAAAANHGDDESTIPLVIWLNGGPGCSSMDGLFLEHGPIRFTTAKDDNTHAGRTVLTRHEHSWHMAPAYVVYVDQPVGTGLSFTKTHTYPRNDEQVNVDFYHWLVEFLQLHGTVFLNKSNNQNKRPIYFAGESHAGHYIPSMMAHILDQNKKDPSVYVELSGAAIGNGWMDPVHQYAAAGAAFGHGLIGMAQMNALNEKEVQCQEKLAGAAYHSSICFDLLDDIVGESQGGTHAMYKVSQYDVRKWEDRHGPRSFPPGHKVVETYLGGWSGDVALGVDKATVLEAIHASEATKYGQRYKECTDPPYNALSHQDGLGVVPQLVMVLENDVPMLFFNGIMDLICNHVGNEVLLEQLPWKHQNEWRLAQRYSWSHDTGAEPAGFMKEFANLYYLKVLDSGHMVPLDVPEVALSMIQTFVYRGSFDTFQQRLDRSLPTNKNDECEPCPKCEAPNSATGTATSEISSEDGAMLAYVIAHSWLGAVLAVVFFLAVLVWVRSRQERPSGSRRLHQTLEPESSHELELRENYRDEPRSDETYGLGMSNGTHATSGSSHSGRTSSSII